MPSSADPTYHEARSQESGGKKFPAFDLVRALDEMSEAGSDETRIQVLIRKTVGHLVALTPEELLRILLTLEGHSGRRRCLKALAPRLRCTRRMDFMLSSAFPGGKERQDAILVLKNVLPHLRISDRGFSPSHLSEYSPRTPFTPQSPIIDKIWEMTPRSPITPSRFNGSDDNDSVRYSPVWPTSETKTTIWANSLSINCEVGTCVSISEDTCVSCGETLGPNHSVYCTLPHAPPPASVTPTNMFASSNNNEQQWETDFDVAQTV